MNQKLVTPATIEEAISMGYIQWLVEQFDSNNDQFVENFPKNLTETQIKSLCQNVFDFYKKVGFDEYRHLSTLVKDYEESTSLHMWTNLGGITIGDASSRDGRVRLNEAYLFNRSTEDLVQTVFETIPHELAHVVHFGIVFTRDQVCTEQCIRLRDASWSKPRRPFGRPRYLAHGKVWKSIYSKMTGWKINNRFFKGVTTKSEERK
jgi:hypothetical protein